METSKDCKSHLKRSNEIIVEKTGVGSTEDENSDLNPCDREYNSWPELPGSSNYKSSREDKSAKNFSHVVKHEECNKETKSLQNRNRGWEQPDLSLHTRKSCIMKEAGKECIKVRTSHIQSEEMKSQQQENLLPDQDENLKPKVKGPFWKSKAQKVEKKRAKEEEARRSMLAPKGQRVRVVNQKVLEAVLNNSVSFVNQPTTAPALNRDEFPTVEEARKQKVKSSESNIEKKSGTSTSFVTTSRIRKRKDPILVDLASLIKHKPRRQECDVGRVQKRDKNVLRYSGNPLDASTPDRKRGKMKEMPRKKKLGHLKSAILEERALRQRLRAITESFSSLSVGIESKPIRPTIHSRKFREYCDNFMTPRLNGAVKLLLKDIVRFQDRQHWKDPVKAFAKRRYVSGFREVQKHLHLKRLKLVIIAPDLEVAKNKGGIDDTIAELKADAEQLEVVYLFALSRRELGYLTFKKVGISCIGICNYDGSENNHQEVLAALTEARTSYQSETSSNIETTPDVTGHMIASLLSKLSDNDSPFLNAIERRSNIEENNEGNV